KRDQAFWSTGSLRRSSKLASVVSMRFSRDGLMRPLGDRATCLVERERLGRVRLTGDILNGATAEIEGKGRPWGKPLASPVRRENCSMKNMPSAAIREAMTPNDKIVELINKGEEVLLTARH